MSKAGLGKSLSALLSSHASLPEAVAQSAKTGHLRYLPIEQLQRGQYQPRKVMVDATLEELAASIKQQGIIQPIVVRELFSHQYEIIAGERRWRAAQLAGLSEVPVVIQALSDEATMAVALIENIQREDLNALEEAQALERLISEFGLTQQQAAEAVGKSRSAVTNLLRLLALNEEVKRLLQHGDIELGHAKVLLSLSGAAQSEAAQAVVAKALTVRATESLVKQYQQKSVRQTKPAIDADVQHLQQTLSEKLGAKVMIHHTTKGKGKLVIQYFDLEELDGIVARLA